ncbi:MAG: Gar1/Naf1 family protein [Candidatus Bathyarchaeota archaeon]|nr:Gar1/Naf1 family protein [Candidatus Bathyarchaeota archaeon]
MPKKLGDVLHRSKSTGNLVVQLKAETKIGYTVIDKQGKRLGEVFDIFGPVDSPYAAIKLREEPDSVPKTVFLEQRERKGPRQSRSKRKRPKGSRSR